MGSNINFKDYGETPLLPVSGSGRATGTVPLTRQSSVYSLTFDEFQNAYSGVGKDFGSMNMDELLKNICSAEETHGLPSYNSKGAEGSIPSTGGNLQRQGSLTLPRTLSQKTVDEVWRDLLKESSGSGGGGGGSGGGGGGGSYLQQRQPTLGEMTLEEFLGRAGVVREDTQPFGMPANTGLFPEPMQANNNGVLAPGLQQPGGNGLVPTNHVAESKSSVPNQIQILGLNAGGLRSSELQQQLQQQPQQPQPRQQRQQLFPKQSTVSFASPVQRISNAQMDTAGTRGAVAGITEPSMNNNLLKGGGLQGGVAGTVGLGAGAVTVATLSPASQISSHVIARGNLDSSSISPTPYTFNGDLRGRKGVAVEKVIERRQRRMIKNRESAARSRARKQAYTLELEAEVEKLKELNQELQKKQAEIMEMHKNQIMETMARHLGGKKRCLRRTLTGPW